MSNSGVFRLKDKKILIISPHPDDEAICAGGLIMRAKKEKAEVFVVYMAMGTSRQFHNGQTLEKDRISEAQKASEVGGFKYKVGFYDVSTKVDSLMQKQLIEKIEDTNFEFKADIVIIPNRNSYNQDHRAVAWASITAFRPTSLRPRPQIILEMEEPQIWPYATNVNFYVDISDVFEQKIELYKCHKTQVMDDPSPRSIENLERIAGLRGSDIGVQYAESFNLLRGQL